jgi:hypothetical protein
MNDRRELEEYYSRAAPCLWASAQDISPPTRHSGCLREKVPDMDAANGWRSFLVDGGAVAAKHRIFHSVRHKNRAPLQSAAVGRGLVGDLPYAVEFDQIVEVVPYLIWF